MKPNTKRAEERKVVYHLPDSLTGRCWKCGKKRGVKYGGVCYIKMSDLLKTIQAEQKKRFDEIMINTTRRQKYDFLDQAIQRTVEKTASKIMFYWEQAIVYSEDTKTCLDKKIMLNHFNETKKLLTLSPKEDKDK